MMRSDWSEPDTLDAVKWWQEGKTAAEIAERLSKRGVTRTRNGVIGRLNRLGVRVDSRTAERATETTRVRNRIRARTQAEATKERYAATNKANGALRRQAEPPKPVRVARPAPVAASSPRPWLDRRSDECRWPIGERGAILSCCNPIARGSYCEGHAAIGYEPLTPTQRASLNKLAGWAMKFERASTAVSA